MQKLITLENIKTLIEQITTKFATKTELSDAVNTRVTVSVEPSDGTETWIEVKTEDLYVGGSEPTEQNVLWMEVKDGNT